MMAGVPGNVIALVFAALVAPPVGPKSEAGHSDILLRDRSAHAVAGTGRGTVLTRVKAIRDASTRYAGAEGGLDPGHCAMQFFTITSQICFDEAVSPAAVGWIPSDVYSGCPFQDSRRST